MKAAVLEEIGKPFAIREVPVPSPDQDAVLIRTKTCGICRTDLHIQDGLAYVPSLPHIPGHEPAGIVEAVGGNVTQVHPGDRVVPHLFVTCGLCRYCRTGRDAQCVNLTGILGVTLPGGFAEYFTAPAANVLALPAEVDFAPGGLVSCAVITAVHAYRRAGVVAGDPVLVVGAGGIGQILVQLLKSAGAEVIALSRSEENLAAAREFGADATVSFRSGDPAGQVRDRTGGEGAAVAFDCVGTAQTMKAAAASLRPGGRIVVIGEESESPAIDTIQIAQRELEIVGSRNGSRQDAADAIAMMASGIIRPRITARYPLDRINEAVDVVRTGRSHGRVVVDVS